MTIEWICAFVALLVALGVLLVWCRDQVVYAHRRRSRFSTETNHTEKGPG